MKNKKYYKYIFKLLLPYKLKLVFLVILMILTALGNLFIPLVQERIVDIGIVEKQLDVLIRLVSLSIMVYILIAFLSYIQSKIQTSINCDFQKDLQVRAMEHLQKIKQDVLNKEGILKLSKDVDYNIETMTQITGNSVLQMFIEVFKLGGIIVALMLINWKLATYSLAFIPIRCLVSVIMGCRTEVYSQRNIDAHQKLHRWEDDLYATIPEVKLYGLNDQRNREYGNLINTIMEVIKKISLLSAKDMYIGEGISQTMYMMLYMIAGILIWKDTLTVGGLLVIASYFAYVIDPVDLFSTINLVFANVKPAIDKFEKFMSLSEEDDCAEVGETRTTSHNILKIEDLSFSYGENEVFRNVDVTLEKGKKYVLVGENGSGKSTLIDLILRFTDIQSGLILFNGIDIRKYGVSQLRNNFGVVTQQPNLFHTTVRENITLFGKYELQDIIVNHPLFDFIGKLSDGLETDVGNKATQLSGGEKQKIALARALMKKPEILILDEPTASYDVESKSEFYEMIAGLECTAIIISHDLEILEAADAIILLEDGNIYLFQTYKEFLDYEPKILQNKFE